MQIRVGYEIVYDCVQPTPMVLMLHVHHSRVADIVVPDHLMTEPALPVHGYHDSFGNWCSRIVAPAGRTRIASTAVVNDAGLPDPILASAQQHAVQDLPDDAMVFLLGSRYCETDRLSDTAWSLFGQTPTGMGQGAGDLRLRAQSYRVRLHVGPLHQDGLGGLQRASRGLPRLCPPGRGIHPSDEHPGALLHRLSQRYRGPAATLVDGFRRLVRGLSRWRLAYV